MLMAYINRYVTPFTTGFFLISLISGVMIFFHWGDAYFHGMHEWLSMVLIVPFVLHIWKNWRPMLSYLSRGWLVWPLVLSTVAALAFVVPTMLATGATTGGNPAMAVARIVIGGSLDQLAPLFKKSPEQLADALRAKGFTVSATSATLDQIAKASSKEGRDAMLALLAR